MNAPSIKNLLSGARRQLTQSTSPRLDAELLMAHVLGVARSALFARRAEEITPNQMEQFQALVLRRAQGEPIAYLIKQKEFWSLPLKVTKDTLVPRPETECLVEAMLQYLPLPLTPSHKGRGGCRVADLGTGTGAIALALAKERTDWHIIATDISEKTLEVARANAKQLDCPNVSFRKGHWLDIITEPLDAIVSNPPYIAEDDPHLTGDGVAFEPRIALVAAENGLAALKEIIQKAPSHLKTGGYLFLEHGIGQAPAVKALLEAAGYVGIVSIQDYSGVERIAIARKPKKGDFLAPPFVN